jgi:hypothetical protein
MVGVSNKGADWLCAARIPISKTPDSTAKTLLSFLGFEAQKWMHAAGTEIRGMHQ